MSKKLPVVNPFYGRHTAEMEKSVQNIVLVTDVLKYGIPLHVNSLNDAQGKVIFLGKKLTLQVL